MPSVLTALKTDFAVALSASVTQVNIITSPDANGKKTAVTATLIVTSNLQPGFDTKYQSAIATATDLAWLIETKKALKDLEVSNQQTSDNSFTLISAAAGDETNLNAPTSSTPNNNDNGSAGYCTNNIAICGAGAAGGTAFILIVVFLIWKKRRDARRIEVNNRRGGFDANDKSNNYQFQLTGSGADADVGLEELLDYEPAEASAILKREQLTFEKPSNNKHNTTTTTHFQNPVSRTQSSLPPPVASTSHAGADEDLELSDGELNGDLL
jgi:hypothetical protein